MPDRVQGVEVVVVKGQGQQTPHKLRVEPAALVRCVQTSKKIGVGDLIKQALLEGRYLVTLRGKRTRLRLELFNTRNLSDPEGNYYENRCLYPMLSAGAANRPQR